MTTSKKTLEAVIVTNLCAPSSPSSSLSVNVEQPSRWLRWPTFVVVVVENTSLFVFDRFCWIDFREIMNYFLYKKTLFKPKQKSCCVAKLTVLKDSYTSICGVTARNANAPAKGVRNKCKQEIRGEVGERQRMHTRRAVQSNRNKGAVQTKLYW